MEVFNREYADLGALKADLMRRGLLLVEAKEKATRKRLVGEVVRKLRALNASGRFRDEDVYNVFYELGIILKAGVPVMKAFRMIIEESGRENVKRFLEQVLFQLKEGRNFSDILEEMQAYYDFKPLIPIIRMGERTGQLGESFLNISANMEKWMKIRGEITNALIYPLILVATGIMAVYVMLVYVIPRFEAIVKGFKIVLPIYTRMLFSLSTFLNGNQDIIIIALIAVMLALLVIGRQAWFKQFTHDVMNRLPVIKGLKFSSENLHFLHSLSNLLSGGVPILSAMTLALESFSSRKIREKLTLSVQSLKKGDSLADALKAVDIFPEILPNMVRVGEESGTLPEVLGELYNFLSERYLKKIKKYMSMLEPLIIVSVALFIGLIIMTILPIIMNISDVNM